MGDHESGCFSWLRRRKGKKRSNSLTVTSRSAPVIAHPIVDVEKVETSKALVPSNKEYTMEATKRTLDILAGVAGLVGVPLVKEVIDIGLSILTTCETINQVQERVAELKNRVASYLLVLAKIAKDPENEPMFKSSQGLMEELQDLKDCLSIITVRLEAINQQNIVLTTLLPEANMNTIEECVACFQDAVDRFQTLRGIHAAQDLTRIQHQVENIYQVAQVAVQKIDKVQSSVDKLQAMLESTGLQSDTFSSLSKMPPIPDVFIGRDTVVQRIAENLTSDDLKRSRVCILGPGGIGKTSATLAAMEHPLVTARVPEDHRLWVPCISLTSPAAFLAFLTRRLGLSSQADPLQLIISTLKNGAEPYILLLDNFETPWHPVEGDQSMTKSILKALDGISNVGILLTMRSHFPPLVHWQTERLDVLPLEDCRQIYTAIEPQAAVDEDLDLLLETIGLLPYAVTLIANQAKYSFASPKEVLFEWTKVGSKMLFDVEDSSKGMDQSIELSVGSKYVTSTPGAIELLQALSMLPAGVYRDDLSIWSKSWTLGALSTLHNSALIVTREMDVDGAKKVHLLVLPVVQSYMRQPGRTPDSVRRSTHQACVDFLCTRKSLIEGPNDPKYKVDFPEIEAQETNVEAIMTEVLKELQDGASSRTLVASEEQLDALTTFVSYQSSCRPCLALVEQVLALVQQAQSLYHEAEVMLCLASVQTDLDLNAVAAETYKTTHQLFSKLGNTIRALNTDLCSVTRMIEALEPDSEVRREMAAETKARWEHLFSNPIIEGLVLSWFSETVWLSYPLDYDRPPEVLHGMLRAREVFREVRRPWALHSVLVNLVRSHLQQGEIDDARKMVDDIMELEVEEKLVEGGYTYVCLAHCLKAANNWGPELHQALQDGLKIGKKSGGPYNIAMLLEELVEVYVREKDWPAARLACEETLKECRKGSGFSIDWLAERAQWNLDYIKAREEGLDEPSEYCDPPRW